MSDQHDDRRIIITGSREKVSAPRGSDWWAEQLGAAIVPRGRHTLVELAEIHRAWGILVLQAERVVFHVPSEGLEYFYHPGMAKRRIRSVREGRGDPMVTAMSLAAGDRVLDCTVGRATDATICSFVVGPTGRVLGLESIPVVAALTARGLHTFDSGDAGVNEAMARVEVICADHADYLPTVEPGAFEVVYFDPVFHRPVEKSASMVPLRALADGRPLSAETLALARRVASRVVVVKQRRGTPLWDEIAPDRLVGSSSATVEYGVFPAS